MNYNQAKKLAEYHKFTARELHEILKEALEKKPESYWSKPYTPNGIFDNGYAFNDRVMWLDYREGINDNKVPVAIVTIRILEMFGQYSKVQLPKPKKIIQEIKYSAKPKL